MGVCLKSARATCVLITVAKYITAIISVFGVMRLEVDIARLGHVFTHERTSNLTRNCPLFVQWHLLDHVNQCKKDCWTYLWDYLPNDCKINSVLTLNRLVTVTCGTYHELISCIWKNVCELTLLVTHITVVITFLGSFPLMHKSPLV